MAVLKSSLIEASHAWLHDIAVWGGLFPAIKAKRIRYDLMYGDKPNATQLRPQADTICNAITYREVSYKNMTAIDDALNKLSQVPFCPVLDTNGFCRGVTFNAETLARFIINFGKELGGTWDDHAVSTFEMDQIKDTMIGKLLYDNKCFSSQAGTRTRTSTPGQPPANGYKSTGPHSQDIPNLIGQPNQKITLHGQLICIESDKTGANVPNAFITPIRANGVLVSVNTAEHVNFGSGNGYTDCKCFFDDINVARDVLTKCQARYGNKFANIHLAKLNADPNGYFKVSTEFGEAYIKASKLNEEVFKKDKTNSTSKFDGIFLEDVDMFTNALYHYN